ncbi:MAG: hypothetical protein PHH59_02335 [Methylovulum sp.]|uniref:hypothetical protein n=1 Tax=Methylovulum sp. TaxID=1916980 RepID=UPI002633F396|nr:hypothetical protein [Methylovulum sp.]MDD2722849.1 hypothetical protein [Methylovulum sp.]
MQTSSETATHAPRRYQSHWASRFNISIFVALTLLVSGCWAPAIKPSVAEISKLSRILVVPVESPPLEIAPDPIEDRIPVYRHYRNMAIDFPLASKLYRTSGGVTIAGFVSDSDDGQEFAILGEPAQPVLAIATGLEQAWTPTLVLARQALAQLTENHIKAVLSRDYYRLPMTDADRNAQLSHWHDAIVKWYGQDMTAADYQTYPGIDAVLELGFGNYRIFEGQTSVQVLMKLINPRTRQVIARTRAGTVAVEDGGQVPLNRDSGPFKKLVANMSSQLLKQGLNDIGWRLQ